MSVAATSETPTESSESFLDDDFSLLRHLVLGEEQTALRLIKSQVQHLESIVRGQEVRFARALKSQGQQLQDQVGPVVFQWLQNLSHSADHYDSVGHLMSGPLEAALRVSARQNHDGLAHTLAPVLGTGIYSALTSSLRRSISSLDHLIRRANLPQRLWWRIQARRQRVPYAEFVRQRTQPYAVLQVQLREKLTSEVVCEVSHPIMAEHTSSFTRQNLLNPDVLELAAPDWDSVRFTGRHLALQLRIQGEGGATLKRIATGVLMDCENLVADESSGGLEQGLRPTAEYFLSSLISQEIRKQPRPWLGVLAVIAALAVAGWWGVSFWQQRSHETELVNRLRHEPGIVVTATAHENGAFVVRGLRDPMALRLDGLPAKYALDPRLVSFDFSPFHSLGTEFEKARNAEKAQLSDQTTAEIQQKWQTQNSALETVLERQHRVVESRLVQVMGGTKPDGVDLRWNGEALKVSGAVPASIATLLKEEATRLQALAAVDLSQLQSIPEAPNLVQQIQSLDIPFVEGTPQLDTQASLMIPQLVELMQRLDVASAQAPRYRLRAWPMTAEKNGGNLAMQISRLGTLKRQLAAHGYAVERIEPGIAESESLSGRRGAWMEVLSSGKP